MTEERAKLFLNANEEFRKRIPDYVEIFVRYYGEECRADIEKAFSQALFVGYQRPDDIDSIIRDLFRTKEKELLDRLQDQTNIPVNKLMGGVSLKLTVSHSINKYILFKELHAKGREGRRKEFLENGYGVMSSIITGMTKEEFYDIIERKQIPEKYQRIPGWCKNNLAYYWDEENIDNEYRRVWRDCSELLDEVAGEKVTLDNFEELFGRGVFTSIEAIVPAYTRIIQEYKEYEEKWKEYTDEIDRTADKRNEFQNAEYVLFVKENIEWIPEDRRKGLKEFLEDPSKTYLLDSLFSVVFGGAMSFSSCLESFTDEKEAELNDPDTFSWLRDMIIKDRIKYFNAMGIQLGSEYKDYEQSPEARKVWPDQERIKQLLASQKKHAELAQKRFYESLPSHQQLLRETQERHLLDKGQFFNYHLYQEKGTFVGTNVAEKDGEIVIAPTVFIYFGNGDSDHLDHFIIHELNHLVELHLVGTTSYTYSYICGWDSGTDSMNQEAEVELQESREERRPFELLNEIINELIAQEISEQMHQNGEFFFDEEDRSTYKRTTNYENSLFLVADFYRDFKPVILASRRNGKIDVLLDAVGQENLEALNSLFAIFNKNFNGFEFYALVDMLNKNEDTPQTRIYHDLEDKRDEILERMRQHYLEREQVKGPEQASI